MNPEDSHSPSTQPDPQAEASAAVRRKRLIGLGLIGLTGAVTVTALNEGGRRVLPHAPRIEVIGERALAASLEALRINPPEGAALYRWTLVGDLLSNTLYYGLVGLGQPQGTWARGGLLGLAAGVGAATLPGPLGLGRQPGARLPETPLLTVGWYLAGGLAAAAAARHLVHSAPR